MTSGDAERQELERVIELLGRSTRPGRLLGYVGAKCLQQQEQQVTEFNIATEVFGRSTKSFDPAQDAVVRVEAHRLRKKLRELYEKGGGTHGVQISLPAGTYVPDFSFAPEPQRTEKVAEQVAGAEDASPTSTDAEVTERAGAPRPFRKWAPYFASIIGVICAAIFGFVMLDEARNTQGTSPHSPAERPEGATVAESAEVSEVHFMAGYSGSDVIDNSGVRWTPDRFFTGGGTWPRDGGFVRGTSRPFLFANWRNGEFGYDIPLERGIYEMRLFFVSPHHVGDEKLAGFDVSLNGKPLLTSFDPNMSAQGVDVADEKVFRDIAPDENGFVRLWFSNRVGTPVINALELVPGIPGKLRPIRIITQPTSFVDHKGQRWRADDYYLNGFRSTERRKVSGTDDPELFVAERYGHFSYAIPVDTRGRHTVVLHFAEHYFTKTFSNIKPSAQGKINLTFEPVINNATVSGIEVLDESG
jgi:hypothetical protein